MRKHLLLYALCAGAVVLGQAGIVFAWHGQQQALFVAGEVLGGAFTMVVTCAAFGEVAGLGRTALVERGFERSWAVILIGFGTDLFALEGFVGLASQNALDAVLGSAVLFLTATLVFATVDATISDDPWWIVIPAALYRTILVSWRATVFPRALIAFAIGTGGDLWLALVLEQLLQALHAGQPALWASGLAAAVIVPLAQTFATFAYLDAIGYEPKRSCGE